jgi:tetratricopeptide (TPR) repeat protein
LNFIGYTWAEQGIKLDEAEDMVRRALKLSPNAGYIMDSLGWIYYQKKDYEKALEWLKKADKAQGPDAEILFHLGDCYRALGREDKARESYRQAIGESVSPALRGRIKSRLEEVR